MSLPLPPPISTSSASRCPEAAPPPQAWRAAITGIAVGIPYAVCVTGLESINGRLATVPVHDDVSYLLDGARRIETLDQRGALGLVQSLIVDPPHSPILTTLSFVGQVASLGGYFGVYILGFLWIALSTVCWVELAGRLRAPAYATIAVGLLLLSCPLAWDTVAVFRPDFAAAVFTAIAVGRVALGSLDDRRGALITGAMAGLAILAKPTITPQTLFVFGCVIAAMVIVSFWTEGLQYAARLAAPCGLFLLGLALTAGWYLAINGEGIARYIWQNNFGPLRELWSYKESLASHLLFYITGPGGCSMFGSTGAGLWWVLGSVAALAWLVAADARAGICLLAAIAAAYTVPTVNWHKNIYLGTVFQGLCVMTCGWALLSIASKTNAIPRVRWMMMLVVVGLSVGGIFCLSHRTYAGPHQTDAVALQQLSAAVRAGTEGIKRPRIAMAFTGTINDGNISLEIWRRCGDILDISTTPYSASIDEAWDFLKPHDLVIAAVDVGDWIPGWMPLGVHQHGILERLRGEAAFRVEEIELAGGRTVLLGIRRPEPTANADEVR